MSVLSKWSFRLVLLILWLASSVAMGGVFLAIKSTFGINVFSSTGLHALGSCLASEAHKAMKEKGMLFDTMPHAYPCKKP